MTDMDIRLGQAYGFYQMGQRKNQEDARYPDTDTPDPSQRFFIVCDGVGGLDKGEVASSTVASAIGKYLELYDLEQTFSMTELSYALSVGYEALDRKNTGANRGMATTLTLMVTHRGGITVAHIGDSRIYQIRPGAGVVYRSWDHSLVNALVRSGNITPVQSINHPQSNVITRCMGGQDSESRSEATAYCLTDIAPGDVFLLCSDGVLHDVTDQDLEELIDSPFSLEEKCRMLANKSAGSSDNNTAFLIPVDTVNGMDQREYEEMLENAAKECEAGAIESETTTIDPGVESAEEICATAEHESFWSKMKSRFGNWG